MDVAATLAIAELNMAVQTEKVQDTLEMRERGI
jgi:hypothetical protein